MHKSKEKHTTKSSRPLSLNSLFFRLFYRSEILANKTPEVQGQLLKHYILFLKLVPIFFLIMIAGFIYLLVLLLQSDLSLIILLGIFLLILVREVSTLVFFFNMRKDIIRPLERLEEGVKEIAGGNYGYTISETVPTTITGLFVAFNKMSQQLKKGQAIKETYEQNRKELIAGISHDLKTPITSILGYVEGINEGIANTEEKMATYMNIINKNALYTNQLIDDLFLFSQLDINQMDYYFEPVCILDYFEDIFLEKKIELEDHHHQVTYQITVSPSLKMNLDTKLVHRIISNLIGNALKYQDKDLLKLNLKVQPTLEATDSILISVQDNGPGIDANHLEDVFHVFYRGDYARNKDIGGTGLGLSISRQLVEAHKGIIWAESILDKGTTIYFTLKTQPIQKKK